MDKLDRLGWAAGLAFEAYGVRVGIRTNTPEALEFLAKLLPPGSSPAASPVVDHLFSVVIGGSGGGLSMRRFSLLYAGPVRLARTLDLDEVVQAFESHLHLTIAGRARGRVFVHAGVVGWRGQAIVLPGRTFQGKTTLVAALVRAGASYYSDEYAVFDARGHVHPYGKPLSIRDQPGARARQCAPEALGGARGTEPLPVGLVLVTSYQAGKQWRPRRLSPGRAILALLANAVAARRRPQAVLTTLHKVVFHAPVLNGVRGEADETTGAILRSLAG